MQNNLRYGIIGKVNCKELTKLISEWRKRKFSFACFYLQSKEYEIEKGLEHCVYCEQYPYDIFSAEQNKEEFVQKFDVEKQWIWEDEN